MSRPSDTVDLTNPSKDVAPLRGERTIGQLVADASRDMSDLVRHEIALAKSELKKEAVTAGAGAGLLVGAALFGLVGFVFVWLTAAWGLIQLFDMQNWAAFGIVTLVLLVIAAILGLLGKGRLSKVGPPEKTIETTKNTIAAAKGQR